MEQTYESVFFKSPLERDYDPELAASIRRGMLLNHAAKERDSRNWDRLSGALKRAPASLASKMTAGTGLVIMGTRLTEFRSHLKRFKKPGIGARARVDALLGMGSSSGLFKGLYYAGGMAAGMYALSYA